MKTKDRKSGLGSRLIRDMSALRDALRRKEPLERRFTVRDVEADLRPRGFEPGDVRQLRDDLNLSQAVFAKVCGISLDLVQSWEQGIRKPNPMACRLLELVARDRQYISDLLHGGHAC